MNKTRGDDGIPAKLFQILKDDAVKVLHPVWHQLGKLNSSHRAGQVIFIIIPKKGNSKGCLNYHTVWLISHANKVMLKILQARLQQYVNRELPDVQAGFRKGKGIRDQIANICWIMEKTRESQKNIYFCLTDYMKAFDHMDHNKLWKILKEMGIPDYLICLLKTCVWVKKQQVEPCMDQLIGSRLRNKSLNKSYWENRQLHVKNEIRTLPNTIHKSKLKMD